MPSQTPLRLRRYEQGDRERAANRNAIPPKQAQTHFIVFDIWPSLSSRRVLMVMGKRAKNEKGYANRGGL